MKVLLVTKHIPYPADSGITLRILNLLKCMRLVCQVACAFLTDTGEASRKAVESCTLDVTNYLVESGPRTPAIRRYAAHLLGLLHIPANTKKAMTEVMEKEKPDLVWLEFDYLCHFVPFFRNFGVPVVCGSHNSQFKLDFDIWKSNTNTVYRLKMAPFMLLYYLHERLMFSRADLLTCISNGDLAYYERFIPEEKLRFLPFFFDGNDLDAAIPFTPDHLYLCMVGSLRSYQNYRAAIFALEDIWPRISAQDCQLRLYIVGDTPPDNSPELRRLTDLLSHSERVFLTGKVDSVIPFVKGALASLVPLTIGSGVRTKIIESVACMTPVVSTSIGAEGLPFVDGESIFIADSADALAEKTMLLVTSGETGKRIAEKAHEKYREELSCAAGARMLRAIFRELNLTDI